MKCLQYVQDFRCCIRIRSIIEGQINDPLGCWQATGKVAGAKHPVKEGRPEGIHVNVPRIPSEGTGRNIYLGSNPGSRSVVPALLP